MLPPACEVVAVDCQLTNLAAKVFHNWLLHIVFWQWRRIQGTDNDHDGKISPSVLQACVWAWGNPVGRQRKTVQKKGLSASLENVKNIQKISVPFQVATCVVLYKHCLSFLCCLLCLMTVTFFFRNLKLFSPSDAWRAKITWKMNKAVKKVENKISRNGQMSELVWYGYSSKTVDSLIKSHEHIACTECFTCF